LFCIFVYWWSVLSLPLPCGHQSMLTLKMFISNHSVLVLCVYLSFFLRFSSWFWAGLYYIFFILLTLFMCFFLVAQVSTGALLMCVRDPIQVKNI
jgi:hypothetical protein